MLQSGSGSGVSGTASPTPPRCSARGRVSLAVSSSSLSLSRRCLGQAQRGLQWHCVAFHCGVYGAAEVGRSAARFHAKICSIFARNGRGLAAFAVGRQKGAWLTEQPRVRYSAPWRRPGLQEALAILLKLDFLQPVEIAPDVAIKECAWQGRRLTARPRQ